MLQFLVSIVLFSFYAAQSLESEDISVITLIGHRLKNILLREEIFFSYCHIQTVCEPNPASCLLVNREPVSGCKLAAV